MLQCAIIAGQLFLFNEASGEYVNFNAYSTFEVRELWSEYYVLANSYERADQYKVDGVVTNEMIPAVLNKCAETAQ
jgi:hypothetical protein